MRVISACVFCLCILIAEYFFPLTSQTRNEHAIKHALYPEV